MPFIKKHFKGGTALLQLHNIEVNKSLQNRFVNTPIIDMMVKLQVHSLDRFACFRRTNSTPCDLKLLSVLCRKERKLLLT